MLHTINGFSKAVYIIMKICRIFLIIGFVLLLTATVALYIIPEDTLTWEATGTGSFTLDTGKLNLGEYMDGFIAHEFGTNKISYGGTESFSGTLSVFTAALTVLLIRMFLLYFVLLFTGRACRKIYRGPTPFTCGVNKALISLGVSVILYNVLPSLIGNIMMNTIYRSNKINYNFRINIATLGFIFAYVVLILIFKYGESLEKDKVQASVSVSAPKADACPVEIPAEPSADIPKNETETAVITEENTDVDCIDRKE